MWFRTSTVRVYLALSLFAAVVFAPWWLTLALAFVLSVRFRAWEVVAAGILYDLLWMPQAISLSWDSLPYATLIALLLVLCFEPLRRQLLIGPAVL